MLVRSAIRYIHNHALLYANVPFKMQPMSDHKYDFFYSQPRRNIRNEAISTYSCPHMVFGKAV